MLPQTCTLAFNIKISFPNISAIKPCLYLSWYQLVLRIACDTEIILSVKRTWLLWWDAQSVYSLQQSKQRYQWQLLMGCSVENRGRIGTSMKSMATVNRDTCRHVLHAAAEQCRPLTSIYLFSPAGRYISYSLALFFLADDRQPHVHVIWKALEARKNLK